MKITAIKQQQKRTDRYSIFVDGTYACSLSESGLIQARLATGQELSPAELQTLKETAGMDKAYGSALRYVAMRPRSEWELREYLRRKGMDTEGAEQIVARLTTSGLLDDRAFAKTWVANRRLLKNVSQRRLRLELKQKHIAEEIVEAALREDTADDHHVLQEIIQKKRMRYPDERKLLQYLARQGFRYEDIKNALASAEE